VIIVLTKKLSVTKPCDIDDFCYANTNLIQEYLNLPSSFNALGVPSNVKNFSVGGDEVAHAFELTNDLSISLIPEVQFLLANQIDILIYQGNLDLACNTAGAKRWTSVSNSPSNSFKFPLSPFSRNLFKTACIELHRFRNSA
jgi:cathepsin A (carboxypeptidase C)